MKPTENFQLEMETTFDLLHRLIRDMAARMDEAMTGLRERNHDAAIDALPSLDESLETARALARTIRYFRRKEGCAAYAFPPPRCPHLAGRTALSPPRPPKTRRGIIPNHALLRRAMVFLPPCTVERKTIAREEYIRMIVFY